MSHSLDLVVDASRHGIALGIYDGDATLCEANEPDFRGEGLGALLDSSLEKAGAALTDVKRVLTTLGPGSFTGLRTGIAFCQGLCFSGARNLYGISTLAALRSFGTSAADTCVLLRARPGFWYLGLGAEELFISTEDALAKIAAAGSSEFVCDTFGLKDELIVEYVRAHSVKTVAADALPVKPFTAFFKTVQPSLTQKANYIQPSYYERVKK